MSLATGSIGEISEQIRTGKTPPTKTPEYFDGTYNWYTPGDFSETLFLDSSARFISEKAIAEKKATIFKKHTVLISCIGDIGKIGVLQRDSSCNQQITGISLKPHIDPLFFAYWCKANKNIFQNRARNAVVPILNNAVLSSILVSFPKELDDQKRIAHLLGKVEGLIVRRKHHQQQLDDLLKSVFLEMFSPHSPGYDGWPIVEIKDLAAQHKGAMRTGPFGSNLLHSEFSTEGDVAVLGIDNAVHNRFAWGERRFITNEKYAELQNYRIFPGDVIVTIMGTIGRSAVIPDDIPVAINTKHLAAITLNKEIANPLFLSYSIHSSPYILNQFRSKNRGAIMNGLNLGLIKETKLKRPPIELQNRFAAIHTKIDELKSRYQHSLTDLETLYGALSQKAFKGELDLSRVVLPVEASTDATEFTTVVPPKKSQQHQHTKAEATP